MAAGFLRHFLKAALGSAALLAQSRRGRDNRARATAFIHTVDRSSTQPTRRPNSPVPPPPPQARDPCGPDPPVLFLPLLPSTYEGMGGDGSA